MGISCLMGFYGGLMESKWDYISKKLLKMAIEIVDFPINSMVDLSIVLIMITLW